MKTIKSIASILIAGVLLFSSCSKEDTINPAQPSTGGSSGSSMRVKMTDSPGEYAALNMSVVSVQAYLQNSGWVTLNNTVHTMNVIDLTNGATTELSYNSNLQSGMYTKLKLTFAEANTITINGNASGGGGSASGTFTLSWTGPREVEVEINQEINSSTQAEVLLDFNVVSSITYVGNQYVINPVIKRINDVKTGARGTISGGAHAAIVISNGLFHTSTFADASGNFIFYGVDPGTYTMTIYPTAAQILNGAPQQMTIDNVIITNGQMNQMGTIVLQ